MAEHRSPETVAPRYNRILVPYDGSDASEAALTYASQIPCNEIVLLHVAVDDDVLVPEWGLEWEEDEESEASIQAIMEQMASRLRKDNREVHVEIRVGDVAEEIIHAGMDADLIVMMTHGRGAAGRLIFGSVADRVVRHGRTLTLLLRVGDVTRSPVPPTRIVVALDGSEIAEQALPAAENMAQRLSLPLMLMRAVGLSEIQLALKKYRTADKPPHEQPLNLFEDTKQHVIAEAEKYLGAYAERIRGTGSGIDVKMQVLDGEAAFSLMWVLTPEDILCMTTRGRSGLKRWSIGSVAEKLVREAPCPIMLQRAQEEK